MTTYLGSKLSLAERSNQFSLLKQTKFEASELKIGEELFTLVLIAACVHIPSPPAPVIVDRPISLQHVPQPIKAHPKFLPNTTVVLYVCFSKPLIPAIGPLGQLVTTGTLTSGTLHIGVISFIVGLPIDIVVFN